MANLSTTVATLPAVACQRNKPYRWRPQIQAAGATTHRAIAEALNARGIRTARGGQWHVSTVQNLLAREGAAQD